MMLVTVVKRVLMMSTVMVTVSGGGIEENTEDVINSHEASLRQVEDHSAPDTSKPGDGIDRAVDMLETKLATSVSKLLGVTPCEYPGQGQESPPQERKLS